MKRKEEGPRSNRPAPAATEAASNGPGESALKRTWLIGALLVAATVVAYLPVWRAGFIWDDDTFLLQNPLIQRPDGLFRLWFSTAAPESTPREQGRISCNHRRRRP